MDWLSDGRLLVIGEEHLLRRAAGGSLVTHADLSGLGDGWNEIVVDGRDNIDLQDAAHPGGDDEHALGMRQRLAGEPRAGPRATNGAAAAAHAGHLLRGLGQHHAAGTTW